MLLLSLLLFRQLAYYVWLFKPDFLFNKESISLRSLSSHIQQKVHFSCFKFRSQNKTKIVASPTDLERGTENSLNDSSSFSCDGVSLREWLRLSCNKVNKVYCLFIFKKILDIVRSFHLKGNVLQDLRPSYFTILPSKEVEYIGRFKEVTTNDMPSLQNLKRPGIYSSYTQCKKREKLIETANPNSEMQELRLGYGLNVRFASRGDPDSSHLLNANVQSSKEDDNSEVNWYGSPEELYGMPCTYSSNIYSLGILLFELLSYFDTAKAHASAMSEVCYRILPPNFLSKNPKEAGFCLWLLHPQPSLRPTICDVVQSEVVRGFEKMLEDDISALIYEDQTDSEVLLHFLESVKEQKETHTSILVQELTCIETDIEEAEKKTTFKESRNDSNKLNIISELESAYFSTRSQIPIVDTRPDTHLLSNRDAVPMEDECDKTVGDFLHGLCSYARNSKLEVCGTVRNGELNSSANVICSLSFDRDGEYLAAAGVSQKIKLFEFDALCNDSIDNHYPFAEMWNDSKLSCVSWNSYIRNYIASADYDGVVKIWDASTCQEVCKYVEHEKRAWSVDFSPLDPAKLASGSDDCTVRIWSINERNSVCSIRNIANACCVQYSSHSSNFVAFGSADYKIYCYDLRNADVPWCILSGHEKAVSYVKFIDSDTLVSASTDNTMKRWDLKRSDLVGLSNDACSLTFKGHTNKKNFVGLSVDNGFIACGSETNEVYTYHKSLPMPITCHKFGAMDLVTGEEIDDDSEEFISSVCWRGNSNFMVAANSSGCMKVLRMT